RIAAANVQVLRRAYQDRANLLRRSTRSQERYEGVQSRRVRVAMEELVVKGLHLQSARFQASLDRQGNLLSAQALIQSGRPASQAARIRLSHEQTDIQAAHKTLVRRPDHHAYYRRSAPGVMIVSA